jgi:flavin-dependent dehydrogenase
VRVDVAIAGGGPAASAAAIALRRRGLSCAIVERGDGGGEKVGESLAPPAKPLLEALGLDLARDGHLPCHGHRSVWGSDTPMEMPFDLSPYGHGWHLDRRRFEERLVALAGVPRLMNTRIVDVARVGGRWQVSLWSGRRTPATLDADFLIDATGRRAAIARRLGARIVRHDTLFAHVFFIDATIEDSYTLVEAAEDGWWYRAPVPGGRVVAMFVSDRRTHRTKVVDASSFRLDRVAGDGWLAIGDAACALDPLSSHGLGAALFTGMRAADAIAGGDVASYERAVDTMWNAYVARRRELYASERRWPSAPFWSRRYTAPSCTSRSSPCS